MPCITTLLLENFHEGHGKCCTCCGELTSVTWLWLALGLGLGLAAS